MKLKRLPLILLFAASPAFAGDVAQDAMRVAKIRENARLSGLPRAEHRMNPGDPRPSFVDFHFRNGAPISKAEALDGTIQPGDGRLAEGNVTCSVFLSGRLSVPDAAVASSRPVSGWKSATFSDGRKVTIQQARFSIPITDQWGASSTNSVVCYKVSAQPFTVADLRSGLGSGLRIELSDRQTAELAAFRRLESTLGEAQRNLSPASNGRSPAIVEEPGVVRSASQPVPQVEVVEEETGGNFSTRPL